MLFVDTREQKYDHVVEGFDKLHEKWVKSKLYVGDYARIDDMRVVVDRKAGLHEVAQNLIQQHERFRQEAIRARDAGISLIVLIEDENIQNVEQVSGWKNPRREKWDRIHDAHQHGQWMNVTIPNKPPVNGEKLRVIMESMTEKYGIIWRFCRHNDTALAILNILYN